MQVMRQFRKDGDLAVDNHFSCLLCSERIVGSDRYSHHASLRMIEAQLPLQDYFRRDDKGQSVSSLLDLG